MFQRLRVSQITGISHRCHGKMNMLFPFEDFDGAPDLSQAVRWESVATICSLICKHSHLVGFVACLNQTW